MERYFPETFQWLRNKCTLVIGMTIDSSGSAGMNTENLHLDNRGSNTDSVENVDSAKNIRRSSRARNPPIRFGEGYTH